MPVAYTEGFSPRPRISFGLALSTGYESLAEYLDADLQVDAGVDFEDTPLRLTAALPGASMSWPWRRSTHMHCLSNKTSPLTSWRIELVDRRACGGRSGCARGPRRSDDHRHTHPQGSAVNR